MSALPADIGAATRAAVTPDPQTSSTIHTRYPGARDGYQPPRTGYFDSMADAATADAAAFGLIGTERRRLGVMVQDLLWLDPSTGTPTVRVTDAEQAVDGLMLVSRIEIDLETETTSLEVFG